MYKQTKSNYTQGQQLVETGIQQLAFIAGGVQQSSAYFLANATTYMLQYLSH